MHYIELEEIKYIKPMDSGKNVGETRRDAKGTGMYLCATSGDDPRTQREPTVSERLGLG